MIYILDTNAIYDYLGRDNFGFQSNNNTNDNQWKSKIKPLDLIGVPATSFIEILVKFSSEMIILNWFLSEINSRPNIQIINNLIDLPPNNMSKTNLCFLYNNNPDKIIDFCQDTKTQIETFILSFIILSLSRLYFSQLSLHYFYGDDNRIPSIFPNYSRKFITEFKKIYFGFDKKYPMHEFENTIHSLLVQKRSLGNNHKGINRDIKKIINTHLFLTENRFDNELCSFLKNSWLKTKDNTFKFSCLSSTENGLDVIHELYKTTKYEDNYFTNIMKGTLSIDKAYKVNETYRCGSNSYFEDVIKKRSIDLNDVFDLELLKANDKQLIRKAFGNKASNLEARFITRDKHLLNYIKAADLKSYSSIKELCYKQRS